MNQRRWMRWTVILSVLAMVLAACGDGAGDETTTTTTTDGGQTTTTGEETTTTTTTVEPTGGVFSTYIVEPEHLSPLTSNESEGIAVLRALFKGLVDYDVRTSEARNQVAESIESTDGGKNWTITLKPGWTFHNGEAVTASSFVDAWNYGAYGPNGQQNNSFYSNIVGYDEMNPAEGEEPTAEALAGLAVVDDLTFTVELGAADPQFPIQIGYAAYFPLPSVYFDDPVAFEEAPVGNGPFMMDGVWQHDELISTVAYPDYAGDEKPKAGGIEFRIYADVNTAYNDLRAGNLDIVDQLPIEQIEAARTEFGDRYEQSSSTGFGYLVFPTYLTQLENKDLRAALSMAIDRQSISDVIFSGARAPATSLIPPSLPGYRDTVCENWEFDPEAAKTKYDASGGYPGQVVMWFNSGASHELWIEAIANMWRNTLGIEDIVFEQLEFSEYLPKRDNKEITGPFRSGWGMDYPSPQNFLEPLFATASFPPAGSNDSFFSNADFDRLLSEGNAAAVNGLDEAIPYYQQAEDILCEEVPFAPVYFSRNVFAWSENVEGVWVDAFGDINYTEISVNN